MAQELCPVTERTVSHSSHPFPPDPSDSGLCLPSLVEESPSLGKMPECWDGVSEGPGGSELRREDRASL